MGETLSLPEVPSSVLQFESRVLFVQTVFRVQFTPKRDAYKPQKINAKYNVELLIWDGS